MINFFRQPIEKKLSSLLGAAVTIDDLEMSLFKGTATAKGVRVAGNESADPLLTMRSIRFELSVARALQKQFEVKSLTLDQPAVRIMRRPDGGWNLPRPDHPALGPTESEEDTGGGWRFDLRKVLLVEGRIELVLELPEAADHTITLDGVLGELSRDGDVLRFTLIARSARCGDQPLPGETRLAGTLSGANDMADLASAGLQAHLEIGDALRATVVTDQITSRQWGLTLDLTSSARDLLDLLPPIAALDSIRSLRITGPLRVSTELQIAW